MAGMEKITFRAEDKQEDFYVLEQTRIGGTDYILVSDSAEGYGEAMILKDLSHDGEEEGIFEPVTDEEELAAVAGVFENMLEDVELQ